MFVIKFNISDAVDVDPVLFHLFNFFLKNTRITVSEIKRMLEIV